MFKHFSCRLQSQVVCAERRNDIQKISDRNPLSPNVPNVFEMSLVVSLTNDLLVFIFGIRICLSWCIIHYIFKPDSRTQITKF